MEYIEFVNKKYENQKEGIAQRNGIRSGRLHQTVPLVANNERQME